MIQPNEIRLGNWFNVPNGDQSPFRVDMIDYMAASYCKVGMNVPIHPNHWENKDLEPIHLTEEVLLKCGFKKVRYEKYAHNELNKLRAYPHVMTGGFGVYIMGSYTLPNIKHLHRLQNLFFALTGQELEYRADK